MGAVVASRISVPRTDPAFAGQFVSGYHHGLYAAAGIAFAGALIAIATVAEERAPPRAGGASPPGRRARDLGDPASRRRAAARDHQGRGAPLHRGQLPRHDDRGHRPRLGRVRAGHLPALRLEAGSLSRDARPRLGAGAGRVGEDVLVRRRRVRRGRADRRGPRLRPLAEAPARGAVAAGAHRGGRGSRAAPAPAPPHAGGARVHGRAAPPRPGAGRRSLRRATPTPRPGSSSPAASSAWSAAGSACSTTPSSRASAPPVSTGSRA